MQDLRGVTTGASQLEPALRNDDVTGWGHVGDARIATKVK